MAEVGDHVGTSFRRAGSARPGRETRIEVRAAVLGFSHQRDAIDVLCLGACEPLWSADDDVLKPTNVASTRRNDLSSWMLVNVAISSRQFRSSTPNCSPSTQSRAAFLWWPPDGHDRVTLATTCPPK